MSVGMGSGLDDLVRRQQAEIERLRLAIKLERGKTEKADEDNERLRERLAEAEVLLHDWREQYGDGAQPSGDLIDGTDAFLAANSASVPVPVSFFRGGHHVSHVCENCGEIWIKHIQGGRCPAPADSATRQESDAHG